MIISLFVSTYYTLDFEYSTIMTKVHFTQRSNEDLYQIFSGCSTKLDGKYSRRAPVFHNKETLVGITALLHKAQAKALYFYFTLHYCTALCTSTVVRALSQSKIHVGLSSLECHYSTFFERPSIQSFEMTIDFDHLGRQLS